MLSIDGYGVLKEGQEASKIQKETETASLRELEVKEEFAEGVNSKCDCNEDWCGLKRKLLDAANKVYSYTKSKPRHFET